MKDLHLLAKHRFLFLVIVAAGVLAISSAVAAKAFVAKFASTPTYTAVTHQITVPSTTSQTVDVFDLMVTKEGVSCRGSSGGYCLWANARNAADYEYSQVYRGESLTGTPDSACEIAGYENHSGWFGLDRKAIGGQNTVAVLPSREGSFRVFHLDISPYCEINNTLGTQSVGTPSTVRLTFNNSYFIYKDYFGTGQDGVFKRNVTIPSNPADSGYVTIYSLDGYDSNSKLYAATSNGLYVCQGSDYPNCETGGWGTGPVTGTSGLDLRIVRYKHFSSGGTLLVAASSSKGGLYVMEDDDATSWTQIATIANGLSDKFITDIALDKDYIYITSYGTDATPNGQKKAPFYSAKKLAKSICHPSGSNAASSINAGGLTIGELDDSSTTGSLVMNKLQYYDFDPTTTNCTNSGGTSIACGFSQKVLGVSLYIDPTTGLAKYIYVPSLGPSCDEGGYTVFTAS